MVRQYTLKSLLLLKSGGTLPTDTDYIKVVEKFEIAPKIGMTEYKLLTGAMNSNEVAINGDDATIEGLNISTYLNTSNKEGTTLDTPPNIGELLKISGFTETITTTTPDQETVVYTNNSTSTLGSAKMYIDGYKYTATGSVASDLTMTIEAGKPAKMDFALSMFLDNKGVPAVEANPSITLDSEKPIISSSIDIITKGGTSYTCNMITIKTNNDIQKRYGLGGLKEYERTDSKYTIDMTFLTDNTNYIADYTALLAERVEAIQIKLGLDSDGGLVSGNSVVIDIPVSKVMTVADKDDNGANSRTLTCLVQNDRGNSNKALSFSFGYFA